MNDAMQSYNQLVSYTKSIDSFEHLLNNISTFATILFFVVIVMFIFFIMFMVSVSTSLKDLAEGSIESAKQNKRIADSLEGYNASTISNQLRSDRPSEQTSQRSDLSPTQN